MLATMAIPANHPNVLQSFGRTLTSLNFQTLEPPGTAGRAGAVEGLRKTESKAEKGGDFSCFRSGVSPAQSISV